MSNKKIKLKKKNDTNNETKKQEGEFSMSPTRQENPYIFLIKFLREKKSTFEYDIKQHQLLRSRTDEHNNLALEFSRIKFKMTKYPRLEFQW